MLQHLEKIQLSPYAKMFYVEWLIKPDSARYNMVFMDELSGDLDIGQLEVSIYRYIQDHLLMHSHIENQADEFYWVQNTEIMGLECSDKYSDEELLTYINQPFNLHKDQLCRFKLFRLGKEKYGFTTVLHHILTDALSVKEGVFKELSKYYNNKDHVQPYGIEQQKEKLADLSEFYYSLLQTEIKSKHQAFWKKQLQDIEYIDLSFLKREHKPHQKVWLDRYNLTKPIQFSFNATVINQLNKLKRQYFITPFYFGLCIFATLLHRYTGQTKFVIPYPIAIKRGIHHIYGAQINTTLMPYEFRNDSTFLEIYDENRRFLKSVKTEFLNYTDFPNIELFNESNKNLINIVLFNQANFRRQTYNFDGVIQKSMLDNLNMYMQDMLLFEQEQIEQVLYYQVSFDLTQMDEVLVQNFVDNFQKIFVELLNDLENNVIDKPLRMYSLLTSDMYQYLVHELNHTRHPLPNKTIHALFVEQVHRTPDNIAVTFEGVQLSYAELNHYANQLAVYIQRKYQPQSEDLILLHLDRSHHILISILAILKTGCAYIPVSPEITDIALLHVLADSKAKLILINESHHIKLSKCFIKYNIEPKKLPRLLAVDSPKFQVSPYQANDLTSNQQSSTSLAYVLYTSGSTGQPKGVMMEHLACVNKVLEMVRFSQITPHDVILFKTNYIFDVSFTDIFCGLLTGAQVVVTKDIFDIEEISYLLENNSITVCHFTPSQFDIIKNTKGPQLFNRLRVIHFSGEALEPKLLNGIDEKVSCINYYGPTETGEVSAELLKKNTSSDCVTIGYPIHNVQFYILDKNLNPVPTGVVGELYIGGLALARGYLNQPVMTQEKFIQNSFQSLSEKIKHENDRLYKTGDLVRRLLSGNIEYRGRNDDQIKIRGHRVELGEIESQLTGFPGIKQAIVLQKTRNQGKNASLMPKENYLIAYYISDSEIDTSAIRDYLMERLPDYMLPDTFVRVSAFTLTPNGKLDIRQLSMIEPPQERASHVSPKNALEEKICLNYAEVLHLPKNEISVNDDFFQLGGNSLLAIKLLFKLDCLKIKVADIFKLRTPKKIAENSQLESNDIKQKVENIIQFYKKYNYALKYNSSEKPAKVLNKKNSRYLETIKDFDVNQKINIENVLLTGSTGYLGCHILVKLIKETAYTIYLIVRAESYETALNRITQKFNFYFNEDIGFYKDRLVILNGDIQYPDFKLNDTQFILLADKIDSVIHCASLVKHYGEYDEFYRSNVQSTLNLLEFSQGMRGNEFNYISTIGILATANIPGESYHISDENDCMENFKLSENFYIQTKRQAEQLVIKYRAYGINSSIFRTGNLGMHSTNYRVQENIKENLFFAHLKAIISLKVIPEELAQMEISPVDCAADAIVKIFDKVSLRNQAYHIFNSRLCDLIKIFNESYKLKIKKCMLNEFIDIIIMNINKTRDYNSCDYNSGEDFHLFMLYQLWHQVCNEIHSTQIRVTQEKTEVLLDKLGFHWPIITAEMVKEFVEHAIPSAIMNTNRGNYK